MEKSATGATPIQHSASKQLAQAVKDAGFTDFGFLVIRTGYGDDSLWEQWAEEFSNVIEKSVTGSEGADELIDKLMLAMIDDEELRNASWDGVQGFFDEAREDNMVPPGLDVGFCLAVDTAAMDSLLHPKAGGDPWVWAVDTNHDFEASPDSKDTYPGHFKVAITSVMTGFYPTIAGSSVEVEQLWRSAKPVWKSAV